MTDTEIIDFIRKLDAQVSRDGAEATFKSFGEVALYANKQGYLRMGLELLKCAFEETYPDADLNYLFDKKSDFGIEHLAIDELQFEFVTS